MYLDNGATTYPKPQAVYRAMQTAMVRFGANPGRSGHAMSMAAAEAIYRCRSRVSSFFHCDCPECVAFTLNCTYAINMVLKGILKAGDHVVCSNLEHNALMRPLYALQKQGKISVTTAQVTEGDNDATVDAFRKAIRQNTALIFTTQASNVTGVRVPVERIAALAHAYQIPIAVDCAQSAGVLPIDLQESGIDYLCIPGHKGLYGPMGVGLLVTRRGEGLETILEGGTGTASADLQQPLEMPERLEPGTQNLAGICGLEAGLQFVEKQTPEKLHRQEIALLQLLYDRLSQTEGIRLYTKRPTLSYHVPVLSCNVADVDSETIGSLLGRSGIAVRAGLHCAPAAHRSIGTLEQGTVRICPSAFTTQGEILRVTKMIQEISKKFTKRL